MDSITCAERSAAVMWANDHASQHVGMELLDVGPGRAVIKMQVADTMVNGQAVCHGGYLFMLADSAFAFACNSYNQSTLAQGASVQFIRPAKAGDELTAEAIELSRGRRTGVYDVVVKNQTGAAVAVFRGSSFTHGEPLFDPDTNSKETTK